MINLELGGKGVFITGSGWEIGAALALGFAGEGAKVAVVDIDKSKAEATAHRIAQQGGRAIPLACDVSRWEQVHAAVERATSELGRVDVLVNVAAAPLLRAPVEDLPLETWQFIVDVNLQGTFYCCRAVVPQMKARRWGKIVNFSSTSGRRGAQEGSSAYGASKAGVIGFTSTIARELGPHAINVNCIAPGTIATARFWAGSTRERIEAHQQTLPLRRVGTPDDLVGIVLLLSSERASYITGQTITVDGGWLGL